MVNLMPHEKVLCAVRDAIEESGMSIKELSEHTFIPYASLHRKLLGRYEFNVSELYSVASALDREVSDFL